MEITKIDFAKLSTMEVPSLSGHDFAKAAHYITKRIVDGIDSVFLEYLTEKGMTLEDAKRECEVRRYPNKTELRHNGELIFTWLSSLPVLDETESYKYNYTFRIVKHWKSETIDQPLLKV